jgi:hypothetical protein
LEVFLEVFLAVFLDLIVGDVQENWFSRDVKVVENVMFDKKILFVCCDVLAQEDVG